MPKGFIGGFHGNVGQILSEGNIYNFNINIVKGVIANQQEVEYELDAEGNVKFIIGTGVNKSVEKTEPKKETTSAKLRKKSLLTEEK
mgnify:CR=1 FL=1|tara:strand:- start:418 stop:678 length:261 start_codon:yes stop_codon:yes gene_type:complete